jgi:hypothetical protein
MKNNAFPFCDLTDYQQSIVLLMFPDAGNDDGAVYEFDDNCRVVFRSRAVRFVVDDFSHEESDSGYGEGD